MPLHSCLFLIYWLFHFVSLHSLMVETTVYLMVIKISSDQCFSCFYICLLIYQYTIYSKMTRIHMKLISLQQALAIWFTIKASQRLMWHIGRGTLTRSFGHYCCRQSLTACTAQCNSPKAFWAIVYIFNHKEISALNFPATVRLYYFHPVCFLFVCHDIRRSSSRR